jgi:hypothetical protein
MTPFQRTELAMPPVKVFIRQNMDDYGCSRKAAKEQYNRLKRDEVWVNDLYQVNIDRDPPSKMGVPMIHVSIKRLDKEAAHDWRHFQTIKNELIGPENEGFEIYPAEERLVDVANQYHLYVFADPTTRLPIGFVARGVCYDNVGGSVQRPLNEENQP